MKNAAANVFWKEKKRYLFLMAYLKLLRCSLKATMICLRINQQTAPKHHLPGIIKQAYVQQPGNILGH